MKNINRILVPILIAGMTSSCWKAIVEKEPVDKFCIPDSLMKNTSIDTVRSEPMEGSLRLTGRISFQEDQVLQIFALVSGHVVSVNASLGDYVKKGQLLAEVHSADMANYFNEYRIAQSELSIARKNYEVTKEMRNSGVSSEKDLLTAKGEWDKASARMNKVSEVIRILGGQSRAYDTLGSSYLIVAPINGFIVEKKINTGMEVRPDDAEHLFTISDLREVWVTGDVYESDISKIKPGLSVSITTISYPGETFTGKLEKVSNVIDPNNKVMTVKVRMPNPDFLLMPGMFANMVIDFPQGENEMTLPAQAVLFDDNKSFIILFNSSCDVEMKPIHVLHQFQDKYYFESDQLKPGDRVITKNSLFILTALKKL